MGYKCIVTECKSGYDPTKKMLAREHIQMRKSPETKNFKVRILR